MKGEGGEADVPASFLAADGSARAGAIEAMQHGLAIEAAKRGGRGSKGCIDPTDRHATQLSLAGF